MAVKSSGSLSMKTDIVGEFGGTAPHGLKEYYRNGSAGVTSNNTDVPTSGVIGVKDFYGAVKQFYYTISSHTKQANLYSLATSAGWNGSDPIVVTINSGIYVWSDSTSVAGLTISSNFNGKLTLINNGYIIGRGGNGGRLGGAGGAGGPAVSNSATGVAVTNASGAYIAGGGGGGGSTSKGASGGGGAGGGAGGNSNTRHATMSGGAGGAVGQAGADGESWGSPYIDDNYGGSDGGSGDPRGFGGGAGGGGGANIDTGSSNGDYGGAGGGGGRVLPGTGGNGGDRSGPFRAAGREGGDGGSAGNAGDAGISAYGGEDGAGGGGGWGASGGASAGGVAGGAGGAAWAGTNWASISNSGTIYGST